MADSFSYEQLIASGEGRLFNPDSGRLPLPPMLMFDRITHIDADGGAHGLGKIVAELQDVHKAFGGRVVVDGFSASAARAPSGRIDARQHIASVVR